MQPSVQPWLDTRQVNYFPSRFDPVRHSERFPIPTVPLSGRREKAIIVKENNFQQPGARFRSWDPARQDRFVMRLSEMLADARVTQVCLSVFIVLSCGLTSADPTFLLGC